MEPPQHQPQNAAARPTAVQLLRVRGTADGQAVHLLLLHRHPSCSPHLPQNPRRHRRRCGWASSAHAPPPEGSSCLLLAAPAAKRLLAAPAGPAQKGRKSRVRVGGGQAAAGGGVGSSCRAAKQLERRQKPRCSTPGGSSSCRSAGPLQPHLRSAPDEPDAGLACKSRGQRLFQLPSRCSQARSGRARDPTARRRLHPASELDARSSGCASGGRWGRLAWQLLGLLGGRQWRPGRLGGPDQHFQAFRGG